MQKCCGLPNPADGPYEYLMYFIVGDKQLNLLSTNDIYLVKGVYEALLKLDRYSNTILFTMKAYKVPFKQDRFVWWFEEDVKKIDQKLLNRIWDYLDKKKLDRNYC